MANYLYVSVFLVFRVPNGVISFYENKPSSTQNYFEKKSAITRLLRSGISD